jgi:hypothetical protein
MCGGVLKTAKTTFLQLSKWVPHKSGSLSNESKHLQNGFEVHTLQASRALRTAGRGL